MNQLQTQTVPVAEQASTSKPIECYVPLKQLYTSKVSLREPDVNSDEFKDQVLESMRAEGQKESITTSLYEGGEGDAESPVFFLIEEGPLAGKIGTTTPVQVVDGGHRKAAFKIFQQEVKDGKTTADQINIPDIGWVRCQYVGQISLNDRLMSQVQHNMNRVDTSAGDLADQCGRILGQNPHWTQHKLAKKLHINKGKLSRLLKINRLPDFARGPVMDGQINGLNAMQLANLPLDILDETWVEKAKSMTTSDFAQACNDAKKAKKAEASGAVKTGEFVPPSPYVRKAAYLIEVFQDDSEIQKLGLNKETLAWVVQQDPATLQAAKAKHESAAGQKTERSLVKNTVRAVKNFGITVPKEVAAKSFEEVIQYLETIERDGLDGIIESCKQFAIQVRSGSLDLSSPASD
jgi:hypothetical protein